MRSTPGYGGCAFQFRDFPSWFPSTPGGAFFPAEPINAFKIEKFIKYATLFPGGLYNTSFVFFINEEVFNKLLEAN